MCAHRSADPALETLLLPVFEGCVNWPENGALFLRARDGAALHQRPLPGLVCEQSFKPDVDALRRSGFTVNSTRQGKYSLVLLLPPRQRDESRALMAGAIALLRGGGRIIACASNNEGARSAAYDLERLAGPLQTLSKHKCRVFWTQPLEGPADEQLAAQWLALDEVRTVAGGRFMSRPGVFAWDRIDMASALLAEHLPADLPGHAADLGAGFGYLSVELLSRCPAITAVDLYEAEERALELSRRNLSQFASRAALEYCWHDVTTGLPRTYDVLVSNPPFHTHARTDRPDIGQRFITVAAESLKPGGRLLAVANRHLPYEKVLNANFGEVRILVEAQGFKVVEGIKAK